MTTPEILGQLEKLGSESIRRVLRRHGARDPLFGVKVQDLKKIQKKIGTRHELSLDLYDTGNSDAMYLAGLIADPSKMTRKKLQDWVEKAPWQMIAECTVAWVTAESPHGVEMGFKWIDSTKEPIAAAGWCVLASLANIKPDDELPLRDYDRLLTRIANQIHGAPNRVRRAMNHFLIACGCGIPSLTSRAVAVAQKMGPLEVDMGETACKVPDAVAYIEKVKKAGRLGKKKTQARC